MWVDATYHMQRNSLTSTKRAPGAGESDVFFGAGHGVESGARLSFAVAIDDDGLQRGGGGYLAYVAAASAIGAPSPGANLSQPQKRIKIQGRAHFGERSLWERLCHDRFG